MKGGDHKEEGPLRRKPTCTCCTTTTTTHARRNCILSFFTQKKIKEKEKKKKKCWKNRHSSSSFYSVAADHLPRGRGTRRTQSPTTTHTGRLLFDRVGSLYFVVQVLVPLVCFDSSFSIASCALRLETHTPYPPISWLFSVVFLTVIFRLYHPSPPLLPQGLFHRQTIFRNLNFFDSDPVEFLTRRNTFFFCCCFVSRRASEKTCQYSSARI